MTSTITTLTVGVGKEYATIASAIAAAQNGNVIAVDAGIYTNDTATINANVTLQAVGGVVKMVETQSLPNQKGILVVNNGATIIGFSFTGAGISAADGNNGAGIRYQGGNLVLRNDYFYNNQDGLLAPPLVAGTGTIDIENSEFNHNGAGDGYSHNIYVGDVASFVFNNSYSHDAVVGHDIKSRAENTTITNSRIEDGATGTASYSIDLPNGGNALVQNNVIQQGPDSQNPTVISYGEEGSLRASSGLVVNGNTIVNDLTAHMPLGVNNAAFNVTAIVSNNRIYGLTSAELIQGNATVTNTTQLATSPTLDTSSHWQPVFARTLTVGVGREYATLHAAIAASRNGDTVAVDSGTYTNDTAIINAHITLEAVGGVVNLVETQALANNQGILVVKNGAVIQGFSFSGAAMAASAGNTGAGVLYLGGNLVLRNDDFVNNQIGLLASPVIAATGNVDVESSEFAGNGTGGGSGQNINVSDLARFTFNNSYSHDALANQNINSRAEITTITNSRIEDGTIGTTNYAIDIANGGNALIQNNVIEKSALSPNATIVSYGEGGSLHGNSSLTVSRNTIVDDQAGYTPVGIFNAAPTVTAIVSANALYGLSPAELVQGGATVTGTTQLASHPIMNTTSSWRPAFASVSSIVNVGLSASVAAASMPMSLAFMQQQMRPVASPWPTDGHALSGAVMTDAMRDIISSAAINPDTEHGVRIATDHFCNIHSGGFWNIGEAQDQTPIRAADHDGHSGGDWRGV